MDKQITLPHINLNGTSANTLFEDYLKAKVAVDAAATAMRQIEFHTRDYMQQPDGGIKWKQASREFESRIERLKEISDELMVIIEHVAEFRK